MSTKLSIIHQVSGQKIVVPARCMRLCAQCLMPMALDHYHWQDETTVQLVYLCSHPGTSRFKSVTAKLDRKGDLS